MVLLVVVMVGAVVVVMGAVVVAHSDSSSSTNNKHPILHTQSDPFHQYTLPAYNLHSLHLLTPPLTPTLLAKPQSIPSTQH